MLASPAGEQTAYLDELMSTATGGGSATSYGNDELALEFDDIFHASRDMIRHGELTEYEAALIRPLDDLLTRLSGEHHAYVWQREALDADSRWDEIRTLAQSALSGLPDEERAVGRCAPGGNQRPT